MHSISIRSSSRIAPDGDSIDVWSRSSSASGSSLSASSSCWRSRRVRAWNSSTSVRLPAISRMRLPISVLPASTVDKSVPAICSVYSMRSASPFFTSFSDLSVTSVFLFPGFAMRAPHAQRETGAEDHPVGSVVVAVAQLERGARGETALGTRNGLPRDPRARCIEVVRGELPFQFVMARHAARRGVCCMFSRPFPAENGQAGEWRGRRI